MRKFLIYCLLSFFMVFCGTIFFRMAVDAKAAASQEENADGSSLDQLNGARIGAQTGTVFDQIALDRLPQAQISYFNTVPDMVAALEANKIDGFPCDEPVLRTMMAEDTKLTKLPEYLDTFNFAYVFKKDEGGKKLADEMTDFILKMEESGELDKLSQKWLDGKTDDVMMPDPADLEGKSGSLVMATEALNPPFSFIRNNEIVGFEIELAYLFCEEKGYGLTVRDMSFDAVLPAVQTGKADFGGATVSVTEERKQSVYFSEPHYSGGTVMVVLKDEQEAKEAGPVPELTEFSDLAGKTVSMLTGAPFEDLVLSKSPDVGEFTFFNNNPDMILALKTGKTDAILSNNAICQLAVNRNPDLAMFPQNLKDSTFGFAFAKGNPERDAWQAAYDAIPKEEIDAAWEKWTGADENLKILPDQAWPGKNGRVKVAACDTLEPMSYAGEEGQIQGFDIEVILMMAKNMDVHVDFEGMEFAAILSYVQSGKALMGTGSIIVSDERKEACDFVEYYPASFVLAVRAANDQGKEPSFWDGIRSSFEKTFIRENRWKLFVRGILTTLLITFLAILFGTVLGFAVFMMCRNGNPLANTVTRFCMWVVQGMPMVVLLMILYYIVFGNVSINGIFVAVIGFTITFGATVFGLMKMGVGAVDKGQYEAAYALGYRNRHTFYTIIFPQALPHILPAYKGEIVSLIKATAIVGYIAVQDLTKMGDIVRSRTYEAFFPLIAVTIIYFVLEGLIGFLVSKIEIKFDPRKRRRDRVLEGVKRDD